MARARNVVTKLNLIRGVKELLHGCYSKGMIFKEEKLWKEPDSYSQTVLEFGMICMRERQNHRTGTSTPSYVFSVRSSYLTSARMNYGICIMVAIMHNLVSQANLH